MVRPFHLLMAQFQLDLKLLEGSTYILTLAFYFSDINMIPSTSRYSKCSLRLLLLLCIVVFYPSCSCCWWDSMLVVIIPKSKWLIKWFVSVSWRPWGCWGSAPCVFSSGTPTEGRSSFEMSHGWRRKQENLEKFKPDMDGSMKPPTGEHLSHMAMVRRTIIFILRWAENLETFSYRFQLGAWPCWEHQ